MTFIVRMPVVYELSPEHVCGESELPAWTGWGWCTVFEMARILFQYGEVAWDEYEILKRFGLEKGPQWPGLILLWHSPMGHIRAIGYNPEMLDVLVDLEIQVMVPSEWTQDVFNAVKTGCTHLRVIDQRPVACNEDGNPVHYWP